MEINDVLSISLCVIYDREREMKDIFSIENRKQGLNYKPGEQLYQEELFPVQKYSESFGIQRIPEIERQIIII